MKIRILNEGQFEVSDDLVGELNQLDDRLVAAVNAQDRAAFASVLEDIHEKVVGQGRRLPDEYIGPSDLLLPDRDTTLEEIHEFLGDEGLIPG